MLGNQQVTTSDLLNLFAFRPDINVGATLRLLQDKNRLEVLAEPNLLTVSGREASFLAGGEFPFPVISTTGSGAQSTPVVTIQFRPLACVSFHADRRAQRTDSTEGPAGSQRVDYANALTIQGFLIPAISTRKAETEVDLHEGESFAIAGLIDNRVTQVLSKVPGIGDLPILGHLFRSRSTQKSNSELLVLSHADLVKPFPPGVPPPTAAGFLKKFMNNNPCRTGSNADAELWVQRRTNGKHANKRATIQIWKERGLARRRGVTTIYFWNVVAVFFGLLVMATDFGRFLRDSRLSCRRRLTRRLSPRRRIDRNDQRAGSGRRAGGRHRSTSTPRATTTVSNFRLNQLEPEGVPIW